MLVSVPLYHLSHPIAFHQDAPGEAEFWAAFWGWVSCALVALCLVAGINYRGKPWCLSSFTCYENYFSPHLLSIYLSK